MFVHLSELSKVSLGFKSLQNSFFYVNQATIDTYRIEKRFLIPICATKGYETQMSIGNLNNQINGFLPAETV